MTRLLTHPEIEWREDGTPVAKAFGDVYFSVEDGLSETRTVFLKGCGLPEAWAGRRQFTVAETGFGTGLNFLALWQMWRSHRPGPAARLSFVSFEAFPLRAEDAARAFEAWPELRPFSDQLLARWPGPVRGVRHIAFDEDGIELILHLGDIAETLPASRFAADAWFLDGFSPAKNTGMWAGDIFPLIAARSAPGARAATFTVAGDVRRGLAAAGFDVRKAEGHGRKRQRLEAVLPGEGQQAGATSRVAILGAGIAGATIAARLARAGIEAVVFDPAPGVASGASGNPLALMMPRLDVGETAEAKLLIDAYLAAREFYAGMPGAEMTDVRQAPRNEAEVKRFAKLLADPPLPLEDLEAISGGGLLHKRALILRPRQIVEGLLQGANLRLGSGVTVDLAQRRVNGEAFDAIVLSGGMAIRNLLPGVELTGRQGQVEHLTGAVTAPPSAMASGTYAIALGEERLWGATFEPAGPEDSSEVSDAARAENLKGLEMLNPWWVHEARRGEAVSRASVRATTPDRLPLIGQAPDAGAIENLWDGKSERDVWPALPNVYVAGGYGSRGFTWAPWAAGAILAELLGAPLPADLPSLRAVDPARQILRRLRKGR
ncbi:FAD-dependent 5-carboxymethylaminomethyl-2-thiouridine(34) oxidoreductase MnmC [Hyphomonas sp. WL0036]|uniref:FAD-dependent 5-carboxymethylaminomethyl-2-thiouridine(34) oxidoreductase MnmC n=1 Tax=Hyphomonas sediminis TaxID=2866160 RepID=UPI001C814B0D|nr:FAD-dependent 5-carboxymethylaminomethyl-2-thiouridine(34) oxidoreductase MnmC [Hyphomonas sediminis]MBY9066274.1 FAD-dependent 5-carboxymethylaminomethyl-2-thiouridine(34) oxidoreductase MnmC [Hyphomonas sediminis]